MKLTLMTLVATLAALGASAAERVSLQDAQKATMLLNNAMGDLKDAPFRLEVNAFKPSAVKGDDHSGALVVPAYSLKQKINGARRKTVIPAGQLWLRGLVPLNNGKAISKDSLRLVKVKTDDAEAEVSMFHLGFQRFGEGGKLLLFGRGKDAVLEVLLKPMKVSQELPIDIEAGKGDDGHPQLVVYVADQFEGHIPLVAGE
jgi:hypothetical protein